MSKERRASLDSKWKLGKERDDYKQHKIDKKGGGAGYQVEPDLVRHRSKRGGSSKVCKKTGGDHVWKMAPHKHSVMRESYNFYKCEKCHKEHWEAKFKYVCSKCGSEESWLWAILNNRDRRICKKCGSKEFKEIPNPSLEK